jgi:hypothetical protein
MFRTLFFSAVRAFSAEARWVRRNKRPVIISAVGAAFGVPYLAWLTEVDSTYLQTTS